VYPNKSYIDRLELRRHAAGIERRRNLSKIMLEQQTFFPYSVEYEDIDKEFIKWVDKELEIIYDGKRIPTYKLFSNQKISEYSQTWSNLDDTGNIIMNFKTITRESNPQYGESQGGSYNIPGNRDYPMFFVPVLEKNGQEFYNVYSMKQPFAVNFIYTVSLICNKYELLNKFNELMHDQFKSLECYIAPNGHHMPMVIENITDESEYSLDDRKYYSQSFQIKLMGYIIRKEDYKVTQVPSRFKVSLLGTEKKRKYKKKKLSDTWLGEATNMVQKNEEVEPAMVAEEQLPKIDQNMGWFEVCDPPIDDADPPIRPRVIVDEDYEIPDCCETEESKYYYKVIKLIAEFPYCDEHSVTFSADAKVNVESIETDNVFDFTIMLNGFKIDFDDEVNIVPGDEILINISRKDEYKDAKLTIVGYDPDTAIDKEYNPESSLDDVVGEEDIYVKKKDS